MQLLYHGKISLRKYEMIRRRGYLKLEGRVLFSEGKEPVWYEKIDSM